MTLTAWTRSKSSARTSPRRARQVMPAIVHQAVHLPVRLLQLGGEFGPALLAGDVESAAVALRRHVGGDHPRALPGERLGLGSALAACRAGDDDDLAQEPLAIQVAHGRSRDRRRPHGKRHRIGARDDGVGHAAEAFHREGDGVARLEGRWGLLAAYAPQLGEAAAVAARAGAQDIAGHHPRTARGVGDHLLERPAHVGQQVPADDLAVDVGGERQPQEAFAVAVALQFVAGHQVGAEGGGGVLSLAGAEADLHFGGLQVAGGPVVEDGVADDVVAGLLGREVAALAADDGGDLQLEVQDPGAGWHRNVVMGAVQGVRVGEVEGRSGVPLFGYTDGTLHGPPYAFHVLLEGDEVPYRRGLERRQQPDLRDMGAGRYVQRGRARGQQPWQTVGFRQQGGE